MSAPGARGRNVTWHAGGVSREARAATTGTGATVWMTGLPASGKSTIAVAAEAALIAAGRAAYLLDGDNLRHGLNADLGFSDSDRSENMRRVAEVARLLADAGLVVLVSLISPFVVDRERARALHAAADLPFLEVFVDTPVEECQRRDPKGLYARARAGEIEGMTGLDAPYERPASPTVVVRPAEQSVDEAVTTVLSHLGTGSTAVETQPG